jgi:hypothetical protein
MNRSVVTHHSAAWCRSHRATSRCTAGRVWRQGFGRGGKRATWATLPRVTVPLPLLQPDQKAVRQHHGHGMPMQSWPQPPLVLVPAQLSLGLFMKLFNRMPAMGPADQLFEGGLRGPVALIVFRLFGLASRGSFPHEPTLVPLSVPGDPPAAHRHELLAQPPFGAPPPANRAPLPAGHGLEQLVCPPHRTGRRAPYTHLEVCAQPDHIRLLPRLQDRQEVGIVPIVGIGHDTTMGHPPTRA